MTMRLTTRPPPGMLLVVTLLSLMIMVVFVALALGATEMTEQVGQRYFKATLAEQAARAGLALALQNVQADHTFHQDLSGQLGASQAWYQVTFVARAAPYSTNNVLAQTAALGFESRTVPAGCCYVVSCGSYAGCNGYAEVLARFGSDGQVQILSRWGD